MEGIDRVRNPGTYAFKKKFGGREIVLAGKQYFPLSAIGSALVLLSRFRSPL
jgi:hypothetical protein